ncbi:rod shape-determining protein [Desulfococcaceae bacterium HSG8]|nr:rod shape-determining protein [Desulfococcaceae bacterium HSG8]
MFSKDLAIDLGTANTLVYMRGKGIVLNEPSVVALQSDGRAGHRILAYGRDAKKMSGKVPGNIVVIRPLRDGVITDFEVASAMLMHFIIKVRKWLRIFKPRMVIAVPSGITRVERRAVTEAALEAGARKVFLIEEPMAAAIGADLSVTEPVCSMVADIGGGTTDVAVISLGGIVSGKSVRVAGDKMDASIIRYIRNKYHLMIGESTAENVKMAVGNAFPDPWNIETWEVKGRAVASGIPGIITVTSADIREAISDQMESIITTFREVLEKTPPELAADITERGIVLTGGGALLKNLDKALSDETGLPIKLADNPLLTVALGSGKILDNIKVLKQVMID